MVNPFNSATAVLGLGVVSTPPRPDLPTISELSTRGSCDSKSLRASAAARAIEREGDGAGSGNSARAYPPSRDPSPRDRGRGDDIPSPPKSCTAYDAHYEIATRCR